VIVVGGATGNLGRRVVELLLRLRVEPARILAVTRTPEQLEARADDSATRLTGP